MSGDIGFSYDDLARLSDGLCPICGEPTLHIEMNGDGYALPICVREAEEDPCEPDAVESAFADLLAAEEGAARPPDTAAPPGDDDIVVITASSVQPGNVRWLWDGWLPLGMQSALIGMPGFGKTTVAMLLAAQVTKGELDLAQPADVLFISYEDVIEARLRPMAESSGADLDRLHFLACARTGYVIDLTTRLPEIKRVAIDKAAKLLIIDPLVAGLPAGSINSHRDQDVRSVLAPIAAFAEERGLAVLTTGHFSKSALSALLGTGGSIGFVGAPRSIMAFGPDPKDEQGVHGEKRILAHAKCNVGKLQHSLSVEIVSDMLDPFGAAVLTSRAAIGEESDISADELVRPSQDGGSPRARVIKFLRELLADGPHRSKEVHDLAVDDGIARATLHRAKDDLGVVAYQEGRAWWWRLPGEEDEGAEEAEE